VDSRNRNPKRQRNRATASVEGENVGGKHRKQLQHIGTAQRKSAVITETYNPSPVDIETGEVVSLGKIVRERRKALKMTQGELGRRIGNLTAQAISEIEQDRTKIPSGATAEGLHRVLGIPLDTIVGKRHLRGTSAASYSQAGQIEPSLYRTVRIVGEALASSTGEWLVLKPASHGTELDFPSEDRDAYSIRIEGDAFHPRVKSGEYLVIEPGRDLAAGDEVLVTLKDGRSLLRELAWRREGSTALNSLVDGHRMTVLDSEIKTIHYVAAIVKASRVRA
jgi:transcriptional regulator with XRE-family HTH domain